jgi:hypothetical protein
LAGLTIGSGFVSFWPPADPLEAISGSGFDELHIHRCSVESWQWAFYDGHLFGKSALSVAIPLVLISHSSRKGSGNDVWAVGVPVLPAPPSIDVSGTLLLLDSTVKGSTAPKLVVYSLPDPLPCPCPSLGDANSGSAGIKASAVYNVNSTITPELGGLVQVSIGWDSYFYGSQPDGLPYVPGTAAVHVSSARLGTTDEMRIGQPWSLQYPVTWSAATLYVAFDVSAPYLIGASDWAFFTGPQVIAGSPLVPGTTSIGVTWPDTDLLLGLELIWHSYDPVLGLSRPVVDIFLP